ncbi:MAG: endonuclease III [Cytophagaceae bacterium]
MTRKERYRQFLGYFTENFPEPKTELNYTNPYELLIAVILSAQCTDKRINMVTPELFRKFPSPELLAEAGVDEIFDYIKSVSFPNNKAKHLSGMAKILVNDFNSEVPASTEDLQKMPGVGRKTANVIASVIFNKPTMAVDTHVFRVARRIGLVDWKCKTPLEVEKQLMKHIPEELVHKSHHWLILHGRYVCLARKPRCEKCPLTDLCSYYDKTVVKGKEMA